MITDPSFAQLQTCNRHLFFSVPLAVTDAKVAFSGAGRCEDDPPRIYGKMYPIAISSAISSVLVTIVAMASTLSSDGLHPK